MSSVKILTKLVKKCQNDKKMSKKLNFDIFCQNYVKKCQILPKNVKKVFKMSRSVKKCQ